MKSRVVTIMFTDLKGFADFTSKASRAELMSFLDKTNEIVKEQIERYQGNILKSIGDALLIIFDSPTAAVLAGRDIQMAVREASDQFHNDVSIRVAVHTGEVTLTDQDVFGDAVNLASRIESITYPGDVYFTEATYLAMQRDKVPTSEVGTKKLKGMDVPVKLYRVRFDSEVQAQYLERNQSLFKMIVAPTLPPANLLRLAEPGDRFMAFCADFACATLLCMLFFIISRGPAVWSAYNDIYSIQGHEFRSDKARMVPQKWSRSGESLLIQTGELAMAPFGGATGSYDMVAIMRGNRMATDTLIVRLGGHVYEDFVSMDHTNLFRVLLAEGLQLKQGEVVELGSRAHRGSGVVLESLDFYPEGSWAPRPKGVERAMRAPGIWGRFLNYWTGYLFNYNDHDFHYFLFQLGIAYGIYQVVFLSLFTWTPGCRIMKIRIVRKLGRPLRLFAVVRLMGQLIVVPGFLWTYLPGKVSWAGLLSGSRTIRVD